MSFSLMREVLFINARIMRQKREWIIEIRDYDDQGNLNWGVAEDSWFRNSCRHGCNQLPMKPHSLEECLVVVRNKRKCAPYWRFRNIKTGEIIPYELFV